MKKNILLKGLLFTSIGMMLVLFASCKRYVDPPLYFEEPGDTTKPAARKVLLIAIDGAVAGEYKKMGLPVLQNMLSKSKYTWEGVSDEVSTDAATWKTLMSGVSYSRHKIKDSSFIYTQSINDPQHTSVPNYPSIFSYILSSPRNDMRTTVISPWRTMVEKLVPEVLDPVVAADDVAVKDSALRRIKSGNPDFMVLHFNSVAIAGKAGAFLADNTMYKDAAVKVDAYIGELLTALKARPGYDKTEEWLVIVTSTHGGVGNSYGGPSSAEVNAFSVFYHEKFKQLEFVRSGFSGVAMKGTGSSVIRARIPDDGGLYNPGLAQQTISFKMKSPTKTQYPHFFSKMDKFASTTGWSLFTNSSGIWCISVIGSGESRIQGTTPVVFDDKWHTVTFKFMDSASKRWLVRYTDDRRIDHTDITARGTVTSTSPLTMGWATDQGMGAVTVSFADCMIFNTALSDAEVAALQCAKDITQHPRYANLIGYWPCGDGFGGRFLNKAPGATNKDFVLQGAFTWDNYAEVPCSITPFQPVAGKAALFLKSVDVTVTSLYWLRMNILPVWGLEGSKWLEQYEQEFVKL
ncbi:type I phosphodiesterase/nucleotide pyrophosphatase [Lacibacter cauensis]|uniref:Type I phosphodiesterase/nucleotide pyrophosphatase n=1 Tax=Lacibacter cauensis TaxID=510947 RepID=A0A562SE34_9BACT|nr:alkaline phosphatase family protein [Lacibacter cauensis]TWI79184.1 type I phosphodiesterase/nucleotide pyrophosphatase [Lacibacter cauensis]